MKIILARASNSRFLFHFYFTNTIFSVSSNQFLPFFSNWPAANRTNFNIWREIKKSWTARPERKWNLLAPLVQLIFFTEGHSYCSLCPTYVMLHMSTRRLKVYQHTNKLTLITHQFKDRRVITNTCSPHLQSHNCRRAAAISIFLAISLLYTE